MSSIDKDRQTLRLLMPQWQGGNNPGYHFGARLLAQFAPPSTDVVEEVPVDLTEAGLGLEGGIFARTPLLKQLQAATAILRRRRPDRVVVFGGDCSVDLAPFAYLNERYAGDVAVLWVDAHPDLATPKQFPNLNAMVLGVLLGEGDPEFVGAVSRPLDPAKVLLVGMSGSSPWDHTVIDRLGLLHVPPAAFASSSDVILDWIKGTGAAHILIHFDLDVIDLREFRSLQVADPTLYRSQIETMPAGTSMTAVTRLLQDVAASNDVVGLGITEYFPWDAIALSTMLTRLPLIREQADDR
jgi:arginase